MAKIAICMADGCEEIEALTVVDVIRRAQMEIVMLSVGGSRKVTGSHGIAFETDDLIDNVNWDEIDGIVLPGGMPGTLHLGESAPVTDRIRAFAKEGKLVAAICAAPSVLGDNGLLEGKKATSFPGFEDRLTGAEYVTDPVAVGGNIITSRGMGTAIDFALSIVAYFTDRETAASLGENFMYDRFWETLA